MKISPLIYEPDKSLDVLKQTEDYLDKNPLIKSKIEEFGWVYHTMGMIIPQTEENLWSGHFFPFMDSWDELQISFNLCCFGLYKQAFVSLRSGLELGILSVYYNINDEGHNAVQEWYKSKNSKEANTPRAEKIWKILLSNANIEKFNEKHILRKRFDDLSYLHNYVHSKGYTYSNRLGLFKSNSQNFEPEILDKWLLGFSEIVSLVSTLHLLKYPISVIRYDYSKKFGIDTPTFGGLEEFNIDKFKRVLPAEYIEDIESIAQNDPDVQNIISEIDSLPDMSEEELENQIINLEKLQIEHGEGFTKWLEHQNSLLKQLGQTDFSEKMKLRINILRQWASENNFMDPINIRYGWKTKCKNQN